MRLLAPFALIIFFGVAIIPACGPTKLNPTKAVLSPGLVAVAADDGSLCAYDAAGRHFEAFPADRQALVKLIEAGRLIDDIFLMQYWSGDSDLYARLQKDATPLGKARLQYFWINKGPWSALDETQGLSPRRSR